MIDVLIPVLGRAHRILPLAGSIHEATDVPHQILYLCSPGDDEATEACRLACHEWDDRYAVVMWEAGRADWARKINRGFQMTSAPFLLLGATDLNFYEGWDLHALATAEATGAGVIGTNDIGNRVVMAGNHSTHPLVRRAYIQAFGTIDEMGKVLSESYHHQWVDTELVETAKRRRQWAFSRDSIVEHLHPFWQDAAGNPKSEMDATYEKALSTSREDYLIYMKRRKLWSRHAMRQRA